MASTEMEKSPRQTHGFESVSTSHCLAVTHLGKAFDPVLRSDDWSATKYQRALRYTA
jgi:hypothetical protein